MVLLVTKYDIHPDKVDAFRRFAEDMLKRIPTLPGLVEFRAYRGLAGAPRVIETWEFADMAAFAAWWTSEEVQKQVTEFTPFVLNRTRELWDTSPNVPTPIRPGK
ncbi:MAG: antibiotic biosynthesis monooxygenase [Chloroflexota bacterium]|nr:antibiotic biosynthesis monooxygenase [Chloroflexota bacterium]